MERGRPISCAHAFGSGTRPKSNDSRSLTMDPIGDDLGRAICRSRPGYPVWRIELEPIDLEAVGPRASV